MLEWRMTTVVVMETTSNTKRIQMGTTIDFIMTTLPCAVGLEVVSSLDLPS
jgi:hypothetical protein